MIIKLLILVIALLGVLGFPAKSHAQSPGGFTQESIEYTNSINEAAQQNIIDYAQYEAEHGGPQGGPCATCGVDIINGFLQNQATANSSNPNFQEIFGHMTKAGFDGIGGVMGGVVAKISNNNQLLLISSVKNGCVNGQFTYNPLDKPSANPPPATECEGASCGGSGGSSPTPSGGATITPGKEIPTATPGVGTPTVTPTSTVTPKPSSASTPSPTGTSYSDDMCKCDGLDPSDIFPGSSSTFTAYGKVVGSDMNYAKITGFNFFFYQGDGNNVIVAQKANIAATIASTATGSVRYKAAWELTVPDNLDATKTYRVQATPVCSKKRALIPTSKKYVLGTSDKIQIGTFTPAQILEKNCSFVKFKFE